MDLRITLTRKEAIALRDAMALSSRHCDDDFTLDRIWSEVGDWIDELEQRGLQPGDIF
jgi:hypothetical protein